MTQDETLLKKYNEVISFIETTKRNPSKNIPEERGLYLNWIKPTATRLLQKLDVLLEQVGHGAGAYYKIRNY